MPLEMNESAKDRIGGSRGMRLDFVYSKANRPCPTIDNARFRKQSGSGDPQATWDEIG